MQRMLIACAMTLIAAGCGLTTQQKASVDQFAIATAALADLAANDIVQTRHDVIELRSRMADLGSASIDLNDAANDLDGPLDEAEAENRIRSAAALKDYARMLTAFTSNSEEAHLESAGTTFLTSLRKVEGISISDEQAGAIATLISKGGGLLLEAHKAKVVREVVKQTRDSLRKIADLLRADFDQNELRWAGALERTRDDAILNTLRRDLATAEVGSVRFGRPLTEGDLAALNAGYQSLVTDADRRIKDARSLHQRLIEAADKFVAANEELSIAVNQPDFTAEGIKSFVSTIQELVDAFKVVRGDEP